MVGKRVHFDDETWAAIEAVARDNDLSFQQIADEAFADFLRKHRFDGFAQREHSYPKADQIKETHVLGTRMDRHSNKPLTMF